MKLRIFAAIILVIALLTGCGASNQGNNTPEAQQTNSTPIANETTDEEKSDYYFEYNGVEIAMNVEAKPILDKLGEPMHYFESPSCAFQGMDRVYTYNGFDVYTYTDGDDETEYVFSVVFLNDSVNTREGITLSDSVDKVVSTYGDDYKESSGQYTYSDGNTKLSFLVEDGEVASIEYSLITQE